MRKDKYDETIVKTGRISYNDICSTCNYGDLCVTKKTRQGPVWFCEEFDNRVPFNEQQQPMVEARFQPRAGAGVKVKENDSSQFKGLCINCESRQACKFTKPNGGIWHCEEYK